MKMANAAVAILLTGIVRSAEARTDPRTLFVLLPVATPTGRLFIPVEL